MEVVLLIARLALAVVFGVAGIAKAGDRSASRRAFLEFGVPESLASPLAGGLPIVEILVAAALVPLITAWWGALAALAILLTFSVAIGVKVARGQSPNCRCFGQLHSEPVGWSTLARNLILAAVAGLVVAQGRDNIGLSALNWLGELRTSEVINLIIGLSLTVLLTLAIVLLNRILKQQSTLFGGMETIRTLISDEGEPVPAVRREAAPPKEGLPIGAMAPKFSLFTIQADEVSLDDLLKRGKSVVLLFAGPNCWGCKVLLPAVRIWEREYADVLTFAVLSTGTLEENQNKMIKYEVANLLLDGDSLVADDYQAKWSPAAVLIHPDGRIASQNTYGDSGIREWLRNVIAAGHAEAGSSNGKGAGSLIPQVSTTYSVREVGEAAPGFRLKDLSGKVVEVEDLQGSSTMLLFWHPRCLMCGTLFDDLLAWEEHPPVGAPRLVFVACGEIEDVESVNKHFRSLTLHDPAFDIAPLFGTKFTPSAILIDEEGRIASSLATGSENVRALVGLPKAELPVALHL